MTIGLLITDRNLDALISGIKAYLPDVDVTSWPSVEALAESDFVVTWRQPENIWSKLPKTKVVCSLGAGVDGIIKDPYLPASVDVIRITDTSLSLQLADYVLGVILMKRIKLDCYIKQQAKGIWCPKERYSGNKVVLLGVGQIGQVIGEKLQRNGFDVMGWSKTEKTGLPFPSKIGQQELESILSSADYVVSTLPATPSTSSFVNAKLFEKMSTNCCFINAGRGITVDETALINALNDKVISSAVLDVTQVEPLGEKHPLWQHEKVIITPHIAAITDQAQVVKQIVENYLAFKQGRPLNNVVNMAKGY